MLCYVIVYFIRKNRGNSYDNLIKLKKRRDNDYVFLDGCHIISIIISFRIKINLIFFSAMLTSTMDIPISF